MDSRQGVLNYTAAITLFLARPPHQPVECTIFAGIRHHAPFGKDRLLLILTSLNPTDPTQGGGPTQTAPGYKNEANEHQRPSLEARSSRLLFCESAREEAIMHGSLSEFEKLADHAARSLDSNYPQIDKTAQWVIMPFENSRFCTQQLDADLPTSTLGISRNIGVTITTQPNLNDPSVDPGIRGRDSRVIEEFGEKHCVQQLAGDSLRTKLLPEEAFTHAASLEFDCFISTVPICVNIGSVSSVDTWVGKLPAKERFELREQWSSRGAQPGWRWLVGCYHFFDGLMDSLWNTKLAPQEKNKKYP
ncbi:hypothetical protein B0H14DRAFT_2638526 [Mycena olivaceomarginata]|nr:hypothetical protein B0H14DRAFT_2638526 [Mycena olivaceomarginata]